MIQSIDYLAILPTLIVAVASVAVLMADAFGADAGRSSAC